MGKAKKITNNRTAKNNARQKRKMVTKDFILNLKDDHILIHLDSEGKELGRCSGKFQKEHYELRDFDNKPENLKSK